MLSRFFPFIDWLKGYRLSLFRADLFSGLTVALVLVPQSMAYAQLAGLPVYFGLYAAFLPPMVAALFGSSRHLSTGPVTLISLMTAAALEPVAVAGSQGFIAYAVFLSLMVGLFQFALGVLRLGLVVNFLSHPVMNGFINAAAVICIISQLPKLFGVEVDKADHMYETVLNILRAIPDQTHWPTLGLASLAFAIMMGLKALNTKIPHVIIAVVATTLISWALGFDRSRTVALDKIESDEARRIVNELNLSLNKLQRAKEERVRLGGLLREEEEEYGSRSVESLERRHQLALLELAIAEHKENGRAYRAELRAMTFKARKDEEGVLRFYRTGAKPEEVRAHGREWRIKVDDGPLNVDGLTLFGGGAVVGTIPRGLPAFSVPGFDFTLFLELFPTAMIIALIGFMQAISSARALAAKTGQRLDANQLLIGQGLANVAGSFSQGYPVSGSLSRSAVNLQAGGRTAIAGVISGGIVAVVLLFFTPLLYHLPQSVLAAIIMVAVVSLINVKAVVHSWKAKKFDGFVAIVTFVSTLAFAPHLERGIVIGMILSLGWEMFTEMRPDIALLSLYMDGSFRNAERFGLGLCRRIAVIRFNGSLLFANTSHLEDKVLEQVSNMPDLKHVLLVGNGINRLDASGERTLSILTDRLREAGYAISISGLNDKVLDVMRRTGLYEKVGEDHLFRNVAMALESIHGEAHIDSPEKHCPLARVVFKGLPTSPRMKRRPLILEGPEEDS